MSTFISQSIIFERYTVAVKNNHSNVYRRHNRLYAELDLKDFCALLLRYIPDSDSPIYVDIVLGSAAPLTEVCVIWGLLIKKRPTLRVGKVENRTMAWLEPNFTKLASVMDFSGVGVLERVIHTSPMSIPFMLNLFPKLRVVCGQPFPGLSLEDVQALHSHPLRLNFWTKAPLDGKSLRWLIRNHEIGCERSRSYSWGYPNYHDYEVNICFMHIARCLRAPGTRLLLGVLAMIRRRGGRRGSHGICQLPHDVLRALPAFLHAPKTFDLPDGPPLMLYGD